MSGLISACGDTVRRIVIILCRRCEQTIIYRVDMLSPYSCMYACICIYPPLMLYGQHMPRFYVGGHAIIV